MNTVIEIISEHLRKNGFDGLYQPDAECACLLGALQPCCESFDECRPGYRIDGKDDEWRVSGVKS
jgi:hypothetical protein